LAARELTRVSVGEHAGPVQRVGAALARELGWSSERLSLEIERFAEEAVAEGLLTDSHAGDDLQALASAPPARAS
jgi:hypothetical protein